MIRTAPWLAVTVGIGVVLAVIFLAYPEIDLWAADLFYYGGHDFLIRNTWVAWAVKKIIRPLFNITSIGLGLFILWRVATVRPFNWPRLRNYVFVAVCLGVGPGLISNALFKENWGRARPKQVVEFAGDRQFTPPLIIADQCPRNCSFVSGDASFAFASLAIALLAVRRRKRWVAVALGLGLGMGLLRMMNGSHFLSDVLFAGVFVTLTVLLAYRWMLEGRWRADIALLRGRAGNA